MGFSLSDDYAIFRKIPRWVWIVLLVISVMARAWALTALLGIGIIIYTLLWVFGVISILEVFDDTGPGHKGNKPGVIAWLKR